MKFMHYEQSRAVVSHMFCVPDKTHHEYQIDFGDFETPTGNIL